MVCPDRDNGAALAPQRRSFFVRFSNLRDYESADNPLFSAVDAYDARMMILPSLRFPVGSDLIMGLRLRAWTQ
jgi:hypothetical protein